MANLAILRAALNAAIYQNYNHEISGSTLNTILNSMVDAIGGGYQFRGVATPETNPGTPDPNVFYIAAQVGTYSNFGLSVGENEVALFLWDGIWRKQNTGAASAEVVSQLGQEMERKIGEYFPSININKYWNTSSGVMNGSNGFSCASKMVLLDSSGTISMNPDNGLEFSFFDVLAYDENDTYLGTISDIRGTHSIEIEQILTQRPTTKYVGITIWKSGYTTQLSNADVADFDVKQMTEAGLAKELEQLQTTVEEQTTDIQTLQSDVAGLDSRVKQLETDINGVYVPELLINRFINTSTGALVGTPGWCAVYKMPLIGTDGTISLNPDNALGFYIYSISCYNSSGTYIGEVSNVGDATSFPISTILAQYPAATMVSLNVWKRGYSTLLTESDVADFDVKQISDAGLEQRVSRLEQEIPSEQESDITLTVSLEQKRIEIRSEFSSTHDIINAGGWNDYNFGGNPCFNFRGAIVVEKSTQNQQYINGEGDNICPFAPQYGYIGANHGLNKIRAITVASHGKTFADIGSEWQDENNKKWYIIRIVDENTLWVVSEYYLDGGVYNFYGEITGNLTHVSGATHTGSMTITDAVMAQWYPSEKIISQTILIDGKPVTQSGAYKGAVVDFVEIYEIYDPVSFLDKLKTVVGTLTANPMPNQYSDIGTIARFCNDYRFAKNGSNVVFVDEIILQKMILSNALALNAKQMIKNAFSVNGALEFYLPKTLPISEGGQTFDYRLPAALDTTQYLYFTKPYWADQDDAPDRAIEFITDGTKRIVGLHHGFIPDLGIVNQQNRKDYVGYSWDLSKGTSYANGLQGSMTVNRGDHFSWVTFRKYESVENNPAGIINHSQFVVNGSLYIYVDFNAIGDYSIPVSDEFAGKTIEVLDKTANVELLNTFAQNQMMVNVATATPMVGYIVAKINP